MPFFGDDFFEDENVAEMDDSAALLYQWLIWRQFKHGPLPSPDVLRRLPHRWQSRWEELWPQVEARFPKNADGRLENPRCATERRIAIELATAAREKGRRGGLAAQARLAAKAEKTPSAAERRVGQDSKPSSTTARPQLESGSSTAKAVVEPSPHQTETSPSLRSGESAREARDSPPARRGREPGLPRASATGPHADLVRHFEAEWLRTRPEAGPYAVERRDGVGASKALSMAGGNLDEAKRRVTRMLDDADPWHFDRAGLHRLPGEWNRLGIDVAQHTQNGNGQAHAQPRRNPANDRREDGTRPGEYPEPLVMPRIFRAGSD